MERRQSRTSTASSSRVDEASSSVDQTAERELPPAQNATSINDDDEDRFRKPVVSDDVKPAPDRLFPVPATNDRNVSLLQAIASVGDYTRARSGAFPLTPSSAEVLSQQAYGGGLAAQPHRIDDRQSSHSYYNNLALLQYHHQQQPHLAVTTSLDPAYRSKPSVPFTGPEVLTSASAFPVCDALQQYAGGGVPQSETDGTTYRLGDQLHAALGYQSSSQQCSRLHEVHPQLQQLSYQHPHPTSDRDLVQTVGSVPVDYSTLSFSPYHSVQARFDADRRQSFRPPSSSGSDQRPCGHTQLQVPRFSPTATNATGNFQHEKVIAPSSAASDTLDGCHTFYV